MNKINKVLSSIGEGDISNMHKILFFIKCIIIYKVKNVTD